MASRKGRAPARPFKDIDSIDSIDLIDKIDEISLLATRYFSLWLASVRPESSVITDHGYTP